MYIHVQCLPLMYLRLSWRITSKQNLWEWDSLEIYLLGLMMSILMGIIICEQDV